MRGTAGRLAGLWLSSLASGGVLLGPDAAFGRVANGTVTELRVAAGSQVESGAVLVVIE